MSPAEQVFMMMQQLSAEQQQAVLHLVESFRSPSPSKPQINHAVLADLESRQDPERARREMWGDDEV
jgi:hypothetical protein